MVVACGDDDSGGSEPEDSYDNGEWICYSYGNECNCHVATGDETPSTTIEIVDVCDWIRCCVRYRDDYAQRCDCVAISTNCEELTENKTDAFVVDQCPP
jgi:hypothetical protein